MLISQVEYGRVVHVSGETRHPYTRGKLCPRGYALVEKNYHKDRLKFPVFQEVKGSGKFKQITWEKAYELILNEITGIHARYGHLKPLAFYKGTGNIGIHHRVTGHFFYSLKGTTKLASSSYACGHHHGGYFSKDFIPQSYKKPSLIVIWGANPAATNIHLVPFLLEAGLRGTKLVVIDPLYTRTAELADLYIQIKPGTDGALATLLAKELIKEPRFDESYIKNCPDSFRELAIFLTNINSKEFLDICEVPERAFSLLADWLKKAKMVAHIIGTGLQKHVNGEQNFWAIQTLAALHHKAGNVTTKVLQGNQKGERLFNNEQLEYTKEASGEHRVIQFAEAASGHDPHPVEMLWISCGNPITQEPHSQLIKEFIEGIPFVATVDQFMTPTAQMSNLILPTTTPFEEWDIVMNNWHGAISLNEKAVSPYFQSRSEWRIMTDLTTRLQKRNPDLCAFPVYRSEEEYLNAQFNDNIRERYEVESIADLTRKGHIAMPKLSKAINNRTVNNRTASIEKGQNGGIAGTLDKGRLFRSLISGAKSPSEEYPFWLLTVHHPFRFNSQFQFLDISEEAETCANIHPLAAKEWGIKDGEVVKVCNRQGSLKMKAVYSRQVPKDILLVYQGGCPKSKVNVNRLIPFAKADTGENIAFYDTFVKIEKL